MASLGVVMQPETISAKRSVHKLRNSDVSLSTCEARTSVEFSQAVTFGDTINKRDAIKTGQVCCRKDALCSIVRNGKGNVNDQRFGFYEDEIELAQLVFEQRHE